MSKKRQSLSAPPATCAAEDAPAADTGWNSDQASCESPSESGLAARLHALVAAPPDEPPDWRAVAGGASLEERAALYGQATFWVGPVWDDAPVDPETVRRAVDPLADLGTWMPSLTAEGRAELARDLAVRVPDFSTRVLMDAGLRAALLDGLAPVGRMQVLHAITHPEAPATTPYTVLQTAVLEGAVEDVRAAWSELGTDPGIVLRLSRDLELRQRLRELDPELAGQIDWELSRSLDRPEALDDAAMLELAARPALRALAPLGEAGWWAPDLAPMLDAVQAYLADVQARRTAMADCVSADDDGALTPAVDHLRRRFAEFFGTTLSQAVSGFGGPAADRLGALLELDRETPAEPARGGADWEPRLRAAARAAATRVHAAAEGGWLGGPDPDALLAALEGARTELRATAREGEVDPAEAERRTEQATAWLGESYELMFGPVGGVLAVFDDPSERSRASRCLGQHGRLGAAVQQVLGTSGAGPSESGTRAMLALTDVATRSGQDLAQAVLDEDAASARQAAESFDHAVGEQIQQGNADKKTARMLVPIIEAAYAPIAGSLRGGIATLDNADTVFSLIGLHSTGAAMRKSGDERSDDALAAEHRVDQQLGEVFKGVVNEREGYVRSALSRIRRDLPTLQAESSFDDADAYLADRYLQLHGIDLGLHIWGSELPTALKDDLLDRFPFRHGAAADAEETTHGTTVSPEYFSIGDGVPAGVDPEKVSDKDNIDRMTDVHVARLTEMAEGLGGLTWFSAATDATDGVVAFRHYLADLTMVGELARVEHAFAVYNGATLGFYVRQAEAQGGLTGEASASLQLDLERTEELPALSVELRREVDAADWSRLIQASERADAKARDAVLQDHETLAYVREGIPAPVVWRALWDSLHGELEIADLLRDESSLQDWMEFVGTAAWWGAAIGTLGGFALLDAVGINPQEAIFGVDEDEDLADFDVEAILTTRRKDMTAAEAALDGARAAVDGDVSHKLDATVSGDNRLQSLGELAHTQEAAKGLSVDAQQALGMGGQGTTDAAKVDDDWFQQDSLREAILAMSKDERALMARDPLFLDRLATVTEGDPGAATELMALLLEGKESAQAARLAAYGGGVEWNLIDEPWEAVDAFSKLSDEEQVLQSVDPELRQAWMYATSADSEAMSQIGAMMRASEAAVRTSELSLDDPARAEAAQHAFVTRAIARYTAATRSIDEDPDVAAVSAVSSIAGEARELAKTRTRSTATEAPDRDTAIAPDGWVIADAMEAIWLEIGADVQDRFASSLWNNLGDHDRDQTRAEHGERATEKMAYTETYSNTDKLIRRALYEWQDASLGIASLHALRGAASSGDVDGMVRAIKEYMSDEDVAEHLSNLTHPVVGGLGALEPVYRRFREARRAREAVEIECDSGDGESLDDTPAHTAELEKLRAREQLARDEVAKHPIDVRKGAALQHHDARISATRTLDSFDGAEQDKILSAIRARLGKLGQQPVLDALRADPRDARLLWGSNRDASLLVGTTRGQMDRTMRHGGLFGGAVEMLSRADNEASSRYLTLAQGYQRVLADDAMSDDEREELERLKADVEVSLAEFKAAKQAVADTVSKAAAAAAGAAVTALVGLATGGVGAPVVAAILTTALAGSSEVVIHEALLGDDYDAEDAFAEVCIDVLKTAISAQLSKGWELSKVAMHAKLLESTQGRGLIESAKLLDRVARGTLGELGLNLAEAGVDAAAGDVKDAALAMLDPGMYEHGWEHGLRVGLEGFEDKLKGIDDSAKDAIFAELASQLGKMAGDAAHGTVSGTGRKKAGRDAFGHAKASNPLLPDPKKDPKKYREYVVDRLKKIPGTMVKSAVSDGVEGLTVEVLREGEEYVLTGDADIDADAFVDEVKDAGKAGMKSGRKALLDTLPGAYKDRKKAKKDKKTHDQHRERMKVMRELDHGLSDKELAQFEAWASTREYDPLGGGLYGQKDRLSLFPDLGIELNKAMDTRENKQQTRSAAVQMDIAAFRQEVLDPLHGQLDKHRRQSDLSDGELDAYEDWVLSDPAAITERVKTEPSDFVYRRDQAKKALDRQRGSSSYQELTETERAWFDHAATRPDLLSDLTKDRGSLAISLKTPRDVRAFKEDVAATQKTLAGELLDGMKKEFAGSVLGVSQEDALAFIEREKDTIAAQVELHPTDTAASERAVRRALSEAWADSREASILDRLAVLP